LMGTFSTEGLVYISQSIDDQMSGTRVLPGDVLLNITGASIGRVCVVPSHLCPANVNQHVCIIRTDGTFDPEYLAAILATDKFQAFIWESQAGGTRQAITKQMIEEFLIPWKSTEEQGRLAERMMGQLAEVEKARHAAESQLQDAALLPNRIINQVFADVDGRETTLDDVLMDIQAGKSFQTAERLARADELGVLKVSAVTWSDFRPNEAKALLDAYVPDESHKVKSGDFIISRANTKEFVGAVVLVESDFPKRLLSDKTLRLAVDENRVSKEYLLFALRCSCARNHIEHYATGTSNSMRNISQRTIETIPLCLPTIDEQRQIASQLKSRLEEVSKLQSALTTQINDIEQLPSRILAQAFED